MNQQEMKHFAKRLAARRSELAQLDESARDSTAAVELDQTRQGRLSRMDAMQQQAMAQAAQVRRSAELRRIAAALRRIEQGDFGYCEACDEAIAIGRLKFDPTATLCIACAEAKA